MKLKCPHCDKLFTSKGIGSHIWRMHTDEGKQFTIKQKLIVSSIPRWNKGLTKEQDSRILKYSSKASKTLAGRVGHKHTSESKEKISNAINKRYENGWLPKAGRCKKISYFSKIAGNVLLDGTWELKVAIYFDSLNINWIRNKNRFNYIHLNGKKSTYTPDFYLPFSNTYIEVKGYETELDRCKWSQFIDKLEIWDKKKLYELNILGR